MNSWSHFEISQLTLRLYIFYNIVRFFKPAILFLLTEIAPFPPFTPKVYSRNGCYNSENFSHRGEKGRDCVRDTFLTMGPFSRQRNTGWIQRRSLGLNSQPGGVRAGFPWVCIQFKVGEREKKQWSWGEEREPLGVFKCYDFWASLDEYHE